MPPPRFAFEWTGALTIDELVELERVHPPLSLRRSPKLIAVCVLCGLGLFSWYTAAVSVVVLAAIGFAFLATSRKGMKAALMSAVTHSGRPPSPLLTKCTHQVSHEGFSVTGRHFAQSAAWPELVRWETRGPWLKLVARSGVCAVFRTADLEARGLHVRVVGLCKRHTPPGRRR